MSKYVTCANAPIIEANTASRTTPKNQQQQPKHRESQMKKALLTVCCALWIAAFNTAFADSQDELTQAVVGYEVTLPRVEAYESALADLVQWTQTNPQDAKLFRDKNVRVSSLDEAAKRLESVPGIKNILDKHQITGRDMSLMPMALLSSRAVVMAQMRTDQRSMALPAWAMPRRMPRTITTTVAARPLARSCAMSCSAIFFCSAPW